MKIVKLIPTVGSHSESVEFPQSYVAYTALVGDFVAAEEHDPSMIEDGDSEPIVIETPFADIETLRLFVRFCEVVHECSNDASARDAKVQQLISDDVLGDQGLVGEGEDRLVRLLGVAQFLRCSIGTELLSNTLFGLITQSDGRVALEAEQLSLGERLAVMADMSLLWSVYHGVAY